jgi:hypothetical protein
MKNTVSARNKIITIDVLRGYTVKEVGENFKLSKGRIQKIFWDTIVKVGHDKIRNIMGSFPNNLRQFRDYKHIFERMLNDLPLK